MRKKLLLLSNGCLPKIRFRFKKLPTNLVAAFRATLEEIADSDLLLHVVDITHPNAMAQWKPKMETARRDFPIRMEKEFALMAENQLLYQTSADALARRYSTLKSAIAGRVQ